MVIKTDMLRYFVEVAQTGNLAKAAKNLGRSPAAVSMMLKQFEDHLGSSLFETERKSQLSTLGRFALREAQRELAHFDQTVSSILRYAQSGDGLLKLSCTPSICASIIPRVIQSLQEYDPNLVVEIVDMSQDQMVSKLKSRQVDFGIASEFMLTESGPLEAVPLVSDRYGILCSKDSELAKKPVVQWADLLDYPFIDNHLCRAVDEPVVRRAISESKVHSSSAQAIGAFVKAGIGVTVAPELMCEFLTDDLVLRIPEGKPARRYVQLIQNREHVRSPAMDLFLKELKVAAETA